MSVKAKHPDPAGRLPEDLIQSIDALRLLPYVHDDVSCKFDDKSGVVSVFLRIRVDFPARGPVYDIRASEHIAIVLPAGFPERHPHVIPMREGFPALPHLTRRPGERFGEICLTRQPTADWWHGRNLEDAVLATYRWLTDAAAGELVKSDDPFEPLIVDGRNPVVEVDFEAARTEACKHGGVWDTTAHQIDIPDKVAVRDTEAVRLVIGPGDVPTRLWYQTHPQATPWTVVPVDLDGVIGLAADVGLEARKVQYWIEKGGERSNRVLTVFGVKRPKQVMGQADSEEWVAFDFHRQKRDKEWKVTSHLILRRFDQDLARQVSGLGNVQKPKKVLVVGAGAFGSSVCDLLARSGLTHLTIVDNEALRPHNLARHTLTGHEIGHAKALAVAERLNGIFANEQVAVGMVKNVLDLSDDDLKDLLNGVACILDCSASVAVQHRIAGIKGRQVPLVSGFQILAGQGTVVLVEDRKGRGRSDAIEAAMMMKERRDPIVAGWLTEKTDPLALGGGCSSVSARIPDTRVKIGAAWVADAVLRWLATDEWPAKSMYGIQKISAVPNPVITTEWKQVEIEPIAEATGGWCAFVLTSVIDDLNRFALEAGTTETGGILVGRVNRQSKTFYVCEAWPAPPDSDRSAVGFTRGRRKLASKLAMLEADSGDNLTYVGEWHAHPLLSGARMSARDSTTAKEMAKKLSRDRIPALCVITDRYRHDVHVVEQIADGERDTTSVH